jgi:hypothetical protein
MTQLPNGKRLSLRKLGEPVASQPAVGDKAFTL